MQTLTFPGKFSSLEKISDLIVQSAQTAGLDSNAIYAVQLAVDEACSNIIEHAYRGEGNGDIEVSTQVTEAGLKVIIRDFGAPFNPGKIPTPNLNVPLEKLEPRGVGLYLMRKMMDEVNFEFTPGTGNVLTMVKKK